MIVGGIDEPEGTYSFDLFDSVDSANAVHSEKQIYLKSFLMQVARWDDIEKTRQLPEPDHRYLLETQILKSSESPRAIIDLLVRNRDEWKAIVARRRHLGFRWASLLDRAIARVGPGVSHAIA